MRLALLAPLLIATLLLGGCITFKEEELAKIRSRNLSPEVYAKLRDRECVTPDDIVEMWHKRVPEPFILRQIDRIGCDYQLKKSDLAMLRHEGVTEEIIDAMLAASNRFATRFMPPDYYEANDVYSDEYVDTPPVVYSGSLSFGTEVSRPR
jgi:predicted ATPase with chaperone activity